MAISITKPTVGGSEDTWGTTINTALDTIVDGVNGTSGTIAPDLSTLTINGTDVTSTAAELNILDGVTATTTELNYVDGVTSNIQTQLDTITANDWVTSARIASSEVGASELKVSGNGTTSQFLRSDGDGTFTWATPTDTTYSAGTGMELSGTTFNSLGLGIGQSWAAQTRTSDTWYVNNTGKPIQAMYRVNTTEPNYFEYKTSSSGTVLQMQSTNAASGTRETQTLIVPDGHYYRYRGIYDTVRELR